MCLPPTASYLKTALEIALLGGRFSFGPQTEPCEVERKKLTCDESPYNSYYKCSDLPPEYEFENIQEALIMAGVVTGLSSQGRMLKVDGGKTSERGFCSLATITVAKPYAGKHYNVKEFEYTRNGRERFVNNNHSFISIKTCPCCKEGTDGPQMKSYHQRYQEHQEYLFPWHQEARRVWAELVTHGTAIRTDLLFDDAQAVAHAMMQRARRNVELLVKRLPELGYRFAYPDRVWIPVNAEMHQMLNDLEFNYGQLPLVVRAWFEIVGSVNLMGAHPKLSGYTELNWDGSQYIDGDPLVVETIWFDYLRAEAHNTVYQLPIAPDAGHKAGESSNGAMHLLLPNPVFDAPLLDDGGRWTGTFFIQHLQTCFEWGGFPGLRGGWMPGQQLDLTASQPERDFLTKDLLPII